MRIFTEEVVIGFTSILPSHCKRYLDSPVELRKRFLFDPGLELREISRPQRAGAAVQYVTHFIVQTFRIVDRLGDPILQRVFIHSEHQRTAAAEGEGRSL